MAFASSNEFWCKNWFRRVTRTSGVCIVESEFVETIERNILLTRVTRTSGIFMLKRELFEAVSVEKLI